MSDADFSERVKKLSAKLAWIDRVCREKRGNSCGDGYGEKR